MLTAIGSDGKVYNIGTVTTNGYYGTFSSAWNPPKQDTYTITASFAGDNSYGSSSAATGLFVGPTPTSTASTVTPLPAGLATTSDLMTSIAIAAIVIVFAIVIVGLLMVRTLRKEHNLLNQKHSIPSFFVLFLFNPII